ncbi:MAG: hypothetical protein J6Y21_11085 [Clostridia bacterium]|nr:hypothetical protein [Clostridia bacterium]
MDSFINKRFIRSFSYYLIKKNYFLDLDNITEQDRNFARTLLVLQEECEGSNPVEKMSGIIDYISKSGYVHKQHYYGFQQLRNDLYSLTDKEVYCLYSVMFDIIDYQDISFPACEILLDRYHEIIQYIARKTNTSLIMKSNEDVRSFEKEVYKVLARFVVAFCPLKKVSIWGENYDDGIERSNTVEEGKPFEEYEYLNCYVEVVDQETVTRMKDAVCLAGFKTMELEQGIMLNTNLITFVSKDLSDAVTLQIVGQESFDSYKVMFEKIGTKAFGYIDETPEYCAQRINELFSDCLNDGPLCLRVELLEKPILKTEDLESLQKNYSLRLYARDYRIDTFDDSTWDTTLITQCCEIEVGNWYNYCPNCGRRIDLVNCKKGKTIPDIGLIELFDYATWNCSCGRGYERFFFNYCPICGKNRKEDFENTIEFSLEDTQ